MYSKAGRPAPPAVRHGTPLPELRKAAPGGGQRPHLIGPPTISDFCAAVARHRKAALRGDQAALALRRAPAMPPHVTNAARAITTDAAKARASAWWDRATSIGSQA
jgi:hypothetical protein